MKKLIGILKIAFIATIIISSAIYIRFIIIPEKQFTAIITEFEKACREEDNLILSTLISKQSRLFELINDANKIKVLFEKFEFESAIINVSYIPSYLNDNARSDLICGEIRKRAKIDGEYRSFSDIVIKDDDGNWVIQQFSFPDFLDY